MNQASPADPLPSKEFIVLMAAIMSVVALSIDAMLPALVVIGEDFGLSNPNHAQFIISAIFGGQAVGQLVCGPLSDALGRKRLLMISFVVYLIGSVICLAANNLEQMLVGRFIQGFAGAGPYISTISIIRDRCSGYAMARIMSLVMMIFIMVPVIAPTLGQFMLLLGSWRLIFALLFCYGLAIMLWSFLRLEETLPPTRRVPFSAANIKRGAFTVLTNRTTVSYMICAGLVFGALIGYLNSCLQIFQGIYAVGDAFALYFGALAFTLGLASLSNSRLVRRFGPRSICITALVCFSTSSALLLCAQFFYCRPYLALYALRRHYFRLFWFAVWQSECPGHGTYGAYCGNRLRADRRYLFIDFHFDWYPDRTTV
ncbi:MAG: multidrug effflux MFS transporter [Cellvibrionaceae bacterium]|nr:multidrug effflux MFS transporter [Cellvibrionaceae bacterium]